MTKIPTMLTILSGTADGLRIPGITGAPSIYFLKASRNFPMTHACTGIVAIDMYPYENSIVQSRIWNSASELIEGTENETEPDGAPNALNIPVSSLHGNIWYHLGLAYYLKQDWDNAYRAYKNGFDAGRNDDNRVSTTHWLYMILQRKGDPEAAAKVLDVISADMNVIENMSYHNLCLFYKGELTLSELIGENEDSPAELRSCMAPRTGTSTTAMPRKPGRCLTRWSIQTAGRRLALLRRKRISLSTCLDVTLLPGGLP